MFLQVCCYCCIIATVLVESPKVFVVSCLMRCASTFAAMTVFISHSCSTLGLFVLRELPFCHVSDVEPKC